MTFWYKAQVTSTAESTILPEITTTESTILHETATIESTISGTSDTVAASTILDDFIKQVQSETKSFKREEKLTEILADLPLETKKALGYTFHHLIVECQYAGSKCNVRYVFHLLADGIIVYGPVCR